jgi:hypothetical protein
MPAMPSPLTCMPYDPVPMPVPDPLCRAGHLCTWSPASSLQRCRRLCVWTQPHAFWAVDDNNATQGLTTATMCLHVVPASSLLGPLRAVQAHAFQVAPGPHNDDTTFMWSRPHAFQVVDDTDARASRQQHCRLWVWSEPCTFQAAALRW